MKDLQDSGGHGILAISAAAASRGWGFTAPPGKVVNTTQIVFD